MTYFIRNANTYRVASEESLDIHQTLPVGNYTIKEDPMSGILFLEMVDSFPQVPKLYGNTTRHAGRILSTFQSRPNSTGVMLNGEKGSGKTLLAKTLSIDGAKMGIPTIIINQPWTGDKFNKFMQDIEQECIVLFDEFEKVYDSEDQEAALTLLDGVFPSKKMFIITCNDKWRVNEHMRNRPGRIFYMLDFKGLEDEFIREYCQDNLVNKSYIEKVCQVASLFDQFNFDMLKAVVEEMNRYNESPEEAMEMLNAKPEFSNDGKFDVKLAVNGQVVKDEDIDEKTWHGNPLNKKVYISYWVGKPRNKVDSTKDVLAILDDDEDGDWKRAMFDHNDLVKVDAKDGKFHYQNKDGVQLVLSRVKESSYNYWAF